MINNSYQEYIIKVAILLIICLYHAYAKGKVVVTHLTSCLTTRLILERVECYSHLRFVVVESCRIYLHQVTKTTGTSLP